MSDTLTLFHGTCDAFVANIKKEGLKPCHGKGADAWANHHGHASIVERTNRHPPSVYVSAVREFAEQFAVIAAEENSSKPCVLELEVPSSAFDEQFEADEAATTIFTLMTYGHPVAFRSEKALPAEWIKRTHHKLTETHRPIEEERLAA
jgi:hypothetical protein